MLLASRLRLLLVTLASSPLIAQFTGLATDASGSVLYFSTAHRQAGTTQPFHGKIFRWDATSGLKLHSALERVDPPPPMFPTTAPEGSNNFDLFLPEVLADGQLILINGRGACLRRCGFFETVRGTLQLPNQPEQSLYGLNRFSPNGRFYLNQTTYYVPLVGLRSVDQPNPTNAFYTYIQTLENSPRRIIANTGEAVVSSRENELSILDKEGIRPLLIQSDTPLSQPTIDAEATTVLFTATPPGAPSQVRKLSIASREVTTLSPTQLHCSSPSLSLDGNTALFLCRAPAAFNAPAQVYLWRASNPTAIPITNNHTGIQSALLSGNGQFTFLLANDGSLTRIPTNPLSLAPAHSIVGPTPTFTSGYYTGFTTSYAATPGSLFSVRGFGLSPAPVSAQFPLPTSLDGFRFFYQDTPLPLIQITPTEAILQIPLDLPLLDTKDPQSKPGSLQFRSPTPPLFQNPPQTLRILPLNPVALIDPATNEALAFDANFAKQINSANPLKGGDIFHLYITGLGPTNPAVPTGQPAPTSPLARITTELDCYLNSVNGFDTPAQTPVEILYAGLAPGLAGLYQLDIRLPAQLPRLATNVTLTQHLLECAIPDYGIARLYALP